MIVRSILVLAVLTGLVACGSSSGGTTGTTTAARRREPCPNPNEARMGTLCWSPVGSRWQITANAPGGEYAFDIELLEAGRVRASDHPDASPGTDEWVIDDGLLRVFLANRYVEYRGELTNGTVIVGTAVNVRGDSWEWRGDRMHVGGGCPDEELTLPAREGTAPGEEGCFTMAGTRWTMRSGAGEFVVSFGADGHVQSERAGDSGSDDDTWTQSGANLSFTLDGSQQHTATITRFDRIEGSGWSLERLPTYPPAMH